MQGSQQFEYFWTEVPLIGSSILGEAPGSPPGPEKSLQIALVFILDRYPSFLADFQTFCI